MTFSSKISIADESFFLSLIESDVSFQAFEHLEEKLGLIVPIPEQEDQIKSAIKIRDPEDLLLWIRAIDDGLSSLLNLYWRSRDYGANSDELKGQIQEIAKKVDRLTHKLNAGISWDDILVLATGIWISEHTNKVVTAISDDRDILAAGHLICSYLGREINIRSTYELLIGLTEPDIISNYLRHCDIEMEVMATERIKKSQLEKNLNNLLERAKVSFHPSPKNRSINVTKLLG